MIPITRNTVFCGIIFILIILFLPLVVVAQVGVRVLPSDAKFLHELHKLVKEEGWQILLYKARPDSQEWLREWQKDTTATPDTVRWYGVTKPLSHDLMDSIMHGWHYWQSGYIWTMKPPPVGAAVQDSIIIKDEIQYPGKHVPTWRYFETVDSTIWWPRKK